MSNYLVARPQEIDAALFAPAADTTRPRYGLPEDVAFCRRCVISNQRPNSAVEFPHRRESKKQTIHFADDGVCDACRVAEKKAATNWADRRDELRALCDRHRRSDGRPDCLVPGSGGKDSFYAAHILKTEFGMSPLTVTWAPHIYTAWGWRNHQAWIHAGFDNILVTPNGMVHRLLTRLSTDILFHPFQSFMLGQKNLAPKIACQFDLELIFFGENEAEYGNPSPDADSPVRSYNYFAHSSRDDIMISGVSLRQLSEDFLVSEKDLHLYMPEDPQRLREKNIEVHYLGYYLKWHPQSCYYYAVEHGGFEASPERTPGTYSKYNSIDDRIDDLHYYTTMIKFGIGRATYDAAQEIRSGDITREEGVALVRRYDGEFPERFESELFDYLSIPPEKFGAVADRFEQPIMDRAYFDALADAARSPHLWMKQDDAWRLRSAVWHEDAA